MTTQTIPYPSHGLTLRAPNWLWVALANKRIENRGQGVAGQARQQIGKPIAITASKLTDNEALEASGAVIAEYADTFAPKTNGHYSLLRSRLTDWKTTYDLEVYLQACAGKIVCVAELLGIWPTGDNPGDYWAIPGQWGLRLGRVWLVEPVPCTGGQGFWRLGRCGCGRPRASTAGPRCRACEPVSYPDALTVRAIYGAKGEEI